MERSSLWVAIAFSVARKRGERDFEARRPSTPRPERDTHFGMKLDLRVRNLKTAEDGRVTFEGEELAHEWLVKRPPFVEVLGVATFEIPREVHLRLKAAMRPLDDEEKALVKKLDDEALAARLEREKEARKRDFELQEKHREAMRTADPERLMDIRWTYDGGMHLLDPADPRTITDLAKEAVLAWVAERNEWVKGRGQIVGEATVRVWPGKIPAKEEERVKEGRFFPCTAPDPNEKTEGRA